MIVIAGIGEMGTMPDRDTSSLINFIYGVCTAIIIVWLIGMKCLICKVMDIYGIYEIPHDSLRNPCIALLILNIISIGTGKILNYLFRSNKDYMCIKIVSFTVSFILGVVGTLYIVSWIAYRIWEVTHIEFFVSYIIIGCIFIYAVKELG